MELYKYKNYEEYQQCQIAGNLRKINNSYVDNNSLRSLLNYLIEELNIKPKFILCHGTRRGLEQQYILDHLNTLGYSPKVIGTEISHTAVDYPNTIQWDFHEVKDEWIKKVDIIYSNSFDHSYSPQVCLDAWMSCLTDEGTCILEWSPDCDVRSGSTDPFAATLDEYKAFITERGYIVTDTLLNEGIEDKGLTHQGARYYIVIKNK